METFVAAHYYTALALVEAVRLVIYGFFALMLWLIWQSVRPVGHRCDDLCGRSGEFCGNCGHHMDVHTARNGNCLYWDGEYCHCERMEE